MDGNIDSKKKKRCSLSEKSKDQKTIAVLAQKLGLPKRVLHCKYDEQFNLIELKLSSLERLWILSIPFANGS